MNKYIFRSSRLQMLFKIGALKNFAIFWTKKRLQHRRCPVRPVNIAKFLEEQLFNRTPQMAAFVFFESN